MKKDIISTKNAPGAIGPYSQGIKTGDFIFLSGQIPINPVTHEMVEGIEEQTKQAILNAEAILLAKGSDLNKVVKTTVFLSDINNFSKMNKIYGEFFGNDSPARSTVEVSNLPKGALIEIEVIAIC